MSDSPGSPPLLRPVPVRPQNVNLTVREATPPEAESSPHTPQFSSSVNLEWLNLKLLDPRNIRHSESSNSISRAQSVKNLTAPTLLGIYRSAQVDGDKFDASTNALGTPWGTGAETPAAEVANRDDPGPISERQSAYPARRRSSAYKPAQTRPSSITSSVFYSGLRALLLSSLGILYGIGVATVRGSQSATEPRIAGASTYGWGYLAFWGAAGLVLGYLLPWFDNLCEQTPEQTSDNNSVMTENKVDKGMQRHTDWTLAVRGIGIFIGIAYAIRKLPWDSTLQVAMSLALVNPALWYIIDRSMSGFVVSSAVGLAGSAVLTSIQPAMVPVPAMLSSSSNGGFYGTDAIHHNSSVRYPDAQPMLLGGLASPQTLATGIWRLNVLFCCCVVLGNVGRWLAMNKQNARNS